MNRRHAFARAGALATSALVGVGGLAQRASTGAANKVGEIGHTVSDGTIYLWRWAGGTRGWEAAGFTDDAVAYAKKAPGFDLGKTAVYVNERWMWLSHVVEAGK